MSGTFGTLSVVPWHCCGTEYSNLRRYNHCLIWWGWSLHFPLHLFSHPRFWRTFLLPSSACLYLTCLTWLIFLTFWFSTFFHPAYYQDSPWNCFVNGILGDLYCRSCSTSCPSRAPCPSVNVFSCSCIPFEKMPLLLMWVGSWLD